MTVEEARACWPDKFLWVNPNLGLYNSLETLPENIRRLQAAAGKTRSCLMISEDIPPDWERTVPLVLKTLDAMT
jgi:hypothetical protein